MIIQVQTLVTVCEVVGQAMCSNAHVLKGFPTVFVGGVTTGKTFDHKPGYYLEQKPSLSPLSYTRHAGRF